MAKNQNGELTVLRKILAIIIIGSFFVGPYLYHDKAISKLQTDIDYIKDMFKSINETVNGHLSKKIVKNM